jgi:predicted metal-dependent peptidase
LILDRPFLGNLVLRLPLVAADSWCKTSATDAKSFYYNPEFIDSLNKHQIKFVLIHEALHCALTHFARRGNRTKHKWDLACDFAINPLLVKEGFHPPIDVPIFQQYAGMIAEEIYPMIDDNLNQEPMDQHLYDDQANDDSKQSDGGMREDQLQQEPKPQSKANEGEQGGASSLAQQPAILRPDEIEKLATQWQKNLASSAQIAQQAGKLEGEFAKLVDFFLQPQVSWQSLLAQYMSALARDDFSYSRPSRRSGEAILPALKSHPKRQGECSESLSSQAIRVMLARKPNYPVMWLVKGKEVIPWGARIQLQ